MSFEYNEINKYSEYDFKNEINELLNPLDYTTKEGDIKVDSHEFKVLLSMFGQILDILKETEAGQDIDKKNFFENMTLMEMYMKTAYVMLGSLRENQKKAYDCLHKFQNMSAYPEMKNKNPEIIEEYEDLLMKEYIDFKTKRENLQKEVLKQKDQLKNMGII